MKRLFLAFTFLAAAIGLSAFVIGRTPVLWSISYTPGQTVGGYLLGGTEMRNAVYYNGQLYATVGYFGASNPQNSQVLNLSSPTSSWVQEVNLGGSFCDATFDATPCAREPASLAVINFPTPILTVGSWNISKTYQKATRLYTYEKNPIDGGWYQTTLTLAAEVGTDPPQVRSLAGHYDSTTGVYMSFAGGAPTGIYSGTLAPSAAGTDPIAWNKDTPIAINSMSITGTTATVLYTGAAFPAGEAITITGPTTCGGTSVTGQYIPTANSSGSVSFTTSASGTCSLTTGFSDVVDNKVEYALIAYDGDPTAGGNVKPMAFAEANGVLYASVGFSIEKRIDGPTPGTHSCNAQQVDNGSSCVARWQDFWANPYGSGNSVSESGNRGLDVIGSIPNQKLITCGEGGSTGYPVNIYDIDSSAAYNLELNVTTDLKTELGTTNTGYIICSYNNFPYLTDAKGNLDRVVGMNSHLNNSTTIAALGTYIDGAAPPDAVLYDAYYYLRAPDGTYTFNQIPELYTFPMITVRGSIQSHWMQGNGCPTYFFGPDINAATHYGPVDPPTIPVDNVAWIVEQGPGSGCYNPNGILFLSKSNSIPAGLILTYSNCAGVISNFGSGTPEANACASYYTTNTGTVSYWRLANSDARARIYGGGLNSCTSYTGITSDTLNYFLNGYLASGTLNLSGVTNCTTLASTIQTDMNTTEPTVGVISSGSSIATKEACYIGSQSQWVLTVTAMNPSACPGGVSAAIQPGGWSSCPDWPGGCRIVAQLDGTPGGIGDYILFYTTGSPQSIPPGTAMTETWGLLTVGTVTSGTVGPSQITGSGVTANSAIMQNLSGSGAGSTWVVNYSQAISGEALTLTGFDTQVTYSGGGPNLWIEPNNTQSFEGNTSIAPQASGTGATPLYLTTATGAYASNEGQNPISTSQSLDYAWNQYAGFNKIQWAGDDPPQPVEAAVSSWATSKGITYLPPTTPPFVETVTPSSGGTGGGISVTITGVGFYNVTSVKFGATNATGVTVVSPYQIICTNPSGTGTVDVTVNNANGTPTTSANDQFTY